MKKVVNKATARKVLEKGVLEYSDYTISAMVDIHLREVKFQKRSLDGVLLEVEKYLFEDFPDYDFTSAAVSSSDVRTEEDVEVLPFQPDKQELVNFEEKYIDYSLLTNEELVAHTQSAIESMGKNFLEISALLYTAKRRIRDSEIVSKDIYTYGKDNFGFSKGTVSDYINIAERYLKRWETTDNNFFIPMPVLKTEYEGYSVSQLQAILPIKDEEYILTYCSPSMTVKELKKLAKEWKTRLLEESPSEESPSEESPSEESPSEESPSEESPSEESPSEESPSEESYVHKPLKIYKFNSYDDYNNNLDDMDLRISNLLKSGKKIELTLDIKLLD